MISYNKSGVRLRGFLALCLAYFIFNLSACGTRAGNPDEESEDDKTKAVKIESSPYGDQASLLATETADFSFCVSKFRIKASENNTHKNVKFAPGLIDVSKGIGADWGIAEISPGTYDEIKVEIKNRSNECGVDYSLSYNGTVLTESLNLRWRLNPAVVVDETITTIELMLEQVVEALRLAVEAGNDKAEIKKAAEEALNKGKRKDLMDAG